MLDYKDLKELEEKTLKHKLGELRRELFELRVEKKMKRDAGGIKNSHQLKDKRRDIAKVLTAMHKKA